MKKQNKDNRPIENIKKKTKIDLKKREVPNKKIIEFNVYTRLKFKHNTNEKTYSNKIIENLILNKNTNFAIRFKDRIIYEYQDEFLKR
jgi:hypothetical protein